MSMCQKCEREFEASDWARDSNASVEFLCGSCRSSYWESSEYKTVLAQYPYSNRKAAITTWCERTAHRTHEETSKKALTRVEPHLDSLMNAVCNVTIVHDCGQPMCTWKGSSWCREV